MTSEEELFADEANTPARKLASFLALYVLRLFKYGRILAYPDKLQTNKIGEASVLEAYRGRKLFNAYLKKYPSFLSTKSHEIFVKTCFLNIYNDDTFYDALEPFVRLCAFTSDMLIYIHDRHLPAAFLENTVLLLARVLSSNEFNSKTNLEELVLHCGKYVKNVFNKDVIDINRLIWLNPEFKRVACDYLQML